jgi:hypothetical protein
MRDDIRERFIEAVVEPRRRLRGNAIRIGRGCEPSARTPRLLRLGANRQLRETWYRRRGHLKA